MMRNALKFAIILVLVCCFMGGVTAFVYMHCKGRIAANDRSVLLKSIDAVKPAGGAVDIAKPLVGVPEEDDAVYVARDAAGLALGYVAQGAEQGYSSVVKVIVGVKADDMSIIRVVVLSQLETPGLGANVEATKSNYTLWEKLLGSDKEEKVFNPFLDRFNGAGVDQLDALDAMTAATITSNATKAAVRQAIGRIKKATAKAGD